MSRADRLAMIDRGRRGLSVRRQCELLDLSRASLYQPPPQSMTVPLAAVPESTIRSRCRCGIRL